MKNMSNPKPNFPTVIKTSLPSITKHPKNICLSSKRTTNQSRITFQPDISKPNLLTFLHSMYNPIKLNNQSSLNFKKRKKAPINSPILPQKIPPQVARPGYCWRWLLPLQDMCLMKTFMYNTCIFLFALSMS